VDPAWKGVMRVLVVMSAHTPGLLRSKIGGSSALLEL